MSSMSCEMVDGIENLWGDLSGVEVFKTPNEILEEQAKVLNQITGGAMSMSIDGTSSGQTFNYNIYLISNNAPGHNRRERIFRLLHDTMIYPATIYTENDSAQLRAESEEEFKENLSKIFKSPEIVQIISMAMARSRLNKKP